MLILAAAQRMAAAAVVASACGTTGAKGDVGGGSRTGRVPVDNRLSANELRRRCGIDDGTFTAVLRWDVDGTRTNEELKDDWVDVDNAVEGELVVWGGVLLLSGKAINASDEGYKERPREESIDGTFWAIPALHDGEIENIW
jgi:hypothetical protein